MAAKKLMYTPGGLRLGYIGANVLERTSCCPSYALTVPTY